MLRVWGLGFSNLGFRGFIGLTGFYRVLGFGFGLG